MTITAATIAEHKRLSSFFIFFISPSLFLSYSLLLDIPPSSISLSANRWAGVHSILVYNILCKITNQTAAISSCPFCIIGNEIELIQRRQSICCTGGAVCRKATAFGFDVALLSACRSHPIKKSTCIFAFSCRCIADECTDTDLITSCRLSVYIIRSDRRPIPHGGHRDKTRSQQHNRRC